MSKFIPVLIFGVLVDKFKEWHYILKESLKTKNLNAIIYVLSDFSSFFNILLPVFILLSLGLSNKEALEYISSRMDLMGALFGVFVWASFSCYRISEHYKPLKDELMDAYKRGFDEGLDEGNQFFKIEEDDRE